MLAPTETANAWVQAPTLQMNILVVIEHDGTHIRLASRSAIAFARQVAGDEGRVRCLVLGHDIGAVSQAAASFAPVLAADHAALAAPLADRYAAVLAAAVRDENADMLVAAATTFAKDVVARAAGLLGGVMASDVIGHEMREGALLLTRPMFAGAVSATVELLGSPRIVTVRPSAYPPAEPLTESQPIALLAVDAAALSDGTIFVGVDSKPTGRPDVAEARVVVSGGRALKNSEDYERLIGGLADVLHGATGSSRALVDAGITRNELQVGQTGKIVAPELYFALGISGAVQHLAGMKNSRVIVAVNSDPEAPIFDVADYGLVGDVYQVIPQLIEKFRDCDGATRG